MATPLNVIDLLTHGHKFNWHIEWQFEDHDKPMPHNKDFDDPSGAFTFITNLASNHYKTLVLLSISRRFK